MEETRAANAEESKVVVDNAIAAVAEAMEYARASIHLVEVADVAEVAEAAAAAAIKADMAEAADIATMVDRTALTLVAKVTLAVAHPSLGVKIPSCSAQRPDAAAADLLIYSI